MSLIVRIIDMMDRQLEAARASGQNPAYFLLREEEWAEIRERFKDAGDEAGSITDDSYMGVPVQIGSLGDDDLSRLVISTPAS